MQDLRADTDPSSLDLAGLSCWIVSEGHGGMENQARGLAEALGVAHRVKRVHAKAPWTYLPAAWWLRPLQWANAGDRLEPPWPDLLISCGRRSAAMAMAVRKESGGRTFAVHIQDPHVQPRHFDLLVVPQHDEVRGDNVLTTLGSLHRVTPVRLQEAAQRFAPALAHLPRPLVAVLVGGSNRRQAVSPAVIDDLADKLVALVDNHHAGLAVTPSRRTGASNERILQERLRRLPAVIWDGQGENPYFAYLGLADAIVVTADSVSMVSEACSTGKPVYVYELEGGSKRLRRFHESLRSTGITRPFTGVLARWSYPPLDDMSRTTAAVRERLRQHLANLASQDG